LEDEELGECWRGVGRGGDGRPFVALVEVVAAGLDEGGMGGSRLEDEEDEGDTEKDLDVDAEDGIARQGVAGRREDERPRTEPSQEGPASFEEGHSSGDAGEEEVGIRAGLEGRGV